MKLLTNPVADISDQDAPIGDGTSATTAGGTDPDTDASGEVNAPA